MVLKIFRAIRFLSVAITLVNLLYVYAGLPEVVIIQDTGGAQVSAGRDGFFYAATVLIAIVNALVYAVSFVYKKNVEFQTWFNGLVITVNIFFIISLNFIALYNSGEKYDYGRLEFIIYGSILLFVAWAAGWPLYSLYTKINTKQAV